MSIDVCIGNYGYYNEGGLRDAWISLPKTSEEISDFLSAHGLQDPEHEEIYISDYDGVPFGLTGLFSEFTWLEDLNMLARQMEEREGAVEKVQGALDCGIDGPESVIGLMNWIEQADEIPYYACRRMSSRSGCTALRRCALAPRSRQCRWSRRSCRRWARRRGRHRK